MIFGLLSFILLGMIICIGILLFSEINMHEDDDWQVWMGDIGEDDE